MINSKLTGMGVALITPFKTDETIDFDNLTYQIVKVHKAPFGNHVELTLERING